MESNNPLISIIIPVYNVEKYIESALLSVLNQTYDNIECILVDDCGSDNSFDIVQQVLSRPQYCSNNVKIVRHQCNRGLSAARNTGMECATGDFIFFMDSDDEISNDCLRLHVDCINRTNADFTIGGILLVGSKSVHIKPIPVELENTSPMSSYFQRQWIGSAWNKLYKAKFIYDNSILFEEGLIHEDVLWTFNIVQKTSKIGVVPEETYFYKIRPDSITTKKSSPKKIASLIHIIQEMQDSYNKGLIAKSEEVSFVNYYNFTRFNTSLDLMFFDGKRSEAEKYYKQIQVARIKGNESVYSMLVKLPYNIFCLLIRPIYKIYKQRNNNN